MSELTGTILDGKYELTRLLGEGGMGAVYEGRHKMVGKRVAIKLLHPQYAEREDVVKRFHHEAQAAAAIGHENIADVMDMGQTPTGDPYLVMEYLDGSDLKHLLERSERLPLASIAHIMIQVLEALEAAHAAGIIHRDLKPENIFLVHTRDNPLYVKLLDFGISKFKALDDGNATGLTHTGMVMGTPHYMSPEQASGEKDIDHRTDVYALGVILYEMCTRTLPYVASTYNALIIKIFTEAPPDPKTVNPDLPPDMADIINIAMARDAEDRFADCRAFRERLLPYLSKDVAAIAVASGSAPHFSKQTAPTPLDMVGSDPGSQQKNSHTGLVFALLVLISIGIGVVLYLLLAPSDEPAQQPPHLAATGNLTTPAATLPSGIQPNSAARLGTAAGYEKPSTAPSKVAQPNQQAPLPTQQLQPPTKATLPQPTITVQPGTSPTAMGPCRKSSLSTNRGPAAGGCAGQLPGEHMQWSGSKPSMFADVNRDGTKDLLGWVRFLNTSDGSAFEQIGAFNPLTGERLWMTGPLVDVSNMVNVRAAVVEDRLIVVDATGTIKSFSIDRGKMIWSSMLGERGKQICKDAKGFVRIETKDERAVRVALATGNINPAGSVTRDTKCQLLSGPESGVEGFMVGGGVWNDNDLYNPKIKGMDVDMVVLNIRSNRAFALGSKSPGTEVPMAALYDRSGVTKNKRSVSPRWMSVIPTVPPLTVNEGEPEAAAAMDGMLIAAYEMDNDDDGKRLSALDAATGKNRWDVFIPYSDTGQIHTISVSEGRIYVAHWTYMDIFEAKTGRHLMTIGIW